MLRGIRTGTGTGTRISYPSLIFGGRIGWDNSSNSSKIIPILRDKQSLKKPWVYKSHKLDYNKILQNPPSLCTNPPTPRKEVHRSLPQAVLKIAMSTVEARRSSSSRRHPPKSHKAITSEWNVVHRSPPFQTSPDLRLPDQPCTPLPTLEKPSHRALSSTKPRRRPSFLMKLRRCLHRDSPLPPRSPSQ